MQAVKQSFSILTLISLLMVAGVASASGSHDHDDSHSHHSDSEHEHEHSQHDGMFMVEKKVDGYTVSFMIRPAKVGQKMGGSHDFMVKVEKDGKPLNNLLMKTKVKHPNGQAETKKAMQMNDWFMSGYDLGHKGKHQLMVLFKTADGEIHKAGIYYTE